MKNCDIRIECPILRFHSVLRENTSIAFVVDRRLRVLLWSNGLVEATNLTQDTVEGQDVSSLPFLSRANRDNTTAAIRQLFNEKGGGSKSTMVIALVPPVVALVPGNSSRATLTRKILLHFTAAFFEDYQHVVCLGRELEGTLSCLMRGAPSEVSSLTSETPSGIRTDLEMFDFAIEQWQ